MNKKLEKLSKDELINLKNKIENELKKIITKETKPNKDTILGLKNGDKIFGIRLSFGPNRLAEPKELNGEVDIVDYCIVEDNNLRGNSDDFRISISHPTEPFGIRCTLSKNDYIDEYCMLSIDTYGTGYDSFYTLKPKTWKEDLKRVYQKFLKTRDKYHQEELNIYKKKINMFLESEEKINQYI